MKKFVLTSVVLFFTFNLSLLAYVNPDYQNPVVEVVKATANAVVKIDVESSRAVSVDPFFDEFFRRFFGDQTDPFGGNQNRTERIVGSGFIFDEAGHILTNYHVVEGADKIQITMLDKTIMEAEFVGGDAETDIAVLKLKDVQPNTLPFLDFGDSDSLMIGEWAIAIGNPLGFQHTVTLGVISAVNRKISVDDTGNTYTDLIQTDAAINPGNSGGPLLNIHGEVIGINTALINPSEGTNLGFAIPINKVRNFLEELITYGKLKKAYLGVRIMDIDQNTQKALGLSDTRGALVVEVEKDSPAELTGIRPQDIIKSINGSIVENADHLVNLVRSQKVGAVLSIEVDRNHQKLAFKVTLAELKETTATAVVSPQIVTNAVDSELFGFSVALLTEELRKELSLPANIDGLYISDVKSDSTAYELGIRKGHILISVNRNPIQTIEEFQILNNGLKKGSSVALYLYVPGQGGVFVSFPL